MSKISIQSLLQTHTPAFLATHSVPLFQHKALRSLQHCRTEQLGSHSEYCDHGHLLSVHYNSCRHRSCPQCQYRKAHDWLLRQQARLLDTTHHHWVFTMPHELLSLWRFHQHQLQNILFEAVQQTIKTLANDERYLGAQPGFLLALHTWGRNLSLHPHIHCLISHGGIDDNELWITPKRDILFPAKVMMKVFRGKFLALLKAEFAPDEIPFLTKLYQTEWVVHCCKPYKDGASVADYIARYMRGGALKNGQLIGAKERIAFSYKSHQTGQRERLALLPNDFIKRLLQHVPLKGKPTVRSYGLYHPTKELSLNEARDQLGQEWISYPMEFDWAGWLKDTQPKECALCQKTVVKLKIM
jgi:hypothetical protein